MVVVGAARVGVRVWRAGVGGDCFHELVEVLGAEPGVVLAADVVLEGVLPGVEVAADLAAELDLKRERDFVSSSILR